MLSDLSVSRAATNAGYNNYSYFTGIFKNNVAYHKIDIRENFPPTLIKFPYDISTRSETPTKI